MHGKEYAHFDHKKNEDDAKSVSLWHLEEKDKFFFYKTPNTMGDVPFIVGIQTP